MKLNGSIKSISWSDYLFITSILALTAFEYFYRAGGLIILIISFAAISFINKGNKINHKLILVIFPFVIIAALQTMLAFNQSIFTALYVMISFMTYYLVAENVGMNFPKAFINIVFLFAIISLIFFPLTYSEGFMDLMNSKVSIYFKSLGTDNNLLEERENNNIIIYNFKNYAFSYNRNSGPFWEPGMFAIFLNIALYFNLILKERLWNFKNFIFILTILTTLSTTGYIALCFIFLIYLTYYHRSIFKIFYVIVLVIAAFYISNLEFIQSKVLEDIKFSNTSGSSRFGAILVHLKVFSDYPFTGVGDGAARYILNYTDSDSTPNGISFVFVKYGFFLGVFYFVLMYKACLNIMQRLSDKRMLGMFFFILLLILAFSQDITVRHFYLFLIIWGLFVPIKIHTSSVFISRKLELTNV